VKTEWRGKRREGRGREGKSQRGEKEMKKWCYHGLESTHIELCRERERETQYNKRKK